jgi:outer membrane protein
MRRGPWAALVFAAALSASPLAAQDTAKPLSIEDAVKAGLELDPGLLSADLDARSANAKAAESRYRMLPSLAVSAGYTKLSEEPSFSLDNLSSSDQQALKPYMSTLQALMPVLADIFPSIDHTKDVRIDLQFPIFAGFRLREAAEIAKYQALGKEAASQLGRRALVFEIRRAYWESFRSGVNVEAMDKALELESVIRDETSDLSAQGMASEADRLNENAHYDQAVLALDDARSSKELSLLVLSSLIGDRSAELAQATEYELVSKPGAEALAAALKAAGSEGGDEAPLIDGALSRRAETRAAAIAIQASSAARVASKSELYPSLSINGALSYADPDPRLFPTQDKFNLSWSIGARLRYDIGALPGALERGAAAEADLAKARADLQRQRNAIALDVRKCALTTRRTRDSLELTKAMVTQAEEGLRVAGKKYDVGMAKRSEVLQAELALVRARLSVTSKLVDIEIAQADLVRALGLDE